MVSVRDLRVAFSGQVALRGLNLELRAGERLAVVGASGSGKTTLGRALLGLLTDAQVQATRLNVCGVDVPSADRTALARLRGGAVGLVLQDPLDSLDPLQRVGDALVEVIRAHTALSRAQARSRAVSLLGEMELADPLTIARRYPHQLSGGQRQRVGIALAMCAEPQVLVADEPTSSLDPTLAEQVASLLLSRCLERGVALLLITHDMMLVSALCGQVMVLHAGEVVEAGSVARIHSAPEHPVTRDLLRAAGAWTDADPPTPAAPVGEGAP